VLLAAFPAFASAIVRYRLMDVEVIIKRVLVAAVGLLLAMIYAGTLTLVSAVLGATSEAVSGLRQLIAVLAAPACGSDSGRLDRLYYRDRHDYRRALLSFTRDLNSDLDVNRLSQRLVDRIAKRWGSTDRAVLLTRAMRWAGSWCAGSRMEPASRFHRARPRRWSLMICCRRTG
jgi:hypothetical protein